MSPNLHDELESRLCELFDRQADAMAVNARAWDDPPMATVTTLAKSSRPRSALAAVLATAAAVAFVVGIVAVVPDRRVHVAGQPGAAVPVHFSTPQVSFDADALSIDANGKNFTSAGSTVDVHSDPGTPNEYTTLELIWREHSVEMRLFMYFKSDGRNWWSDELRTYDGNAPGDWIYYTGMFFRAPIGTAFAGNVDLVATEGRGHLQISNLRLQPFLPPAACKNATTKYAIDPSYERVDLARGADGFGMGTTALLDTASCTAVADPRAFAFDWQVANPAVVNFQTYDGNTSSLHATLPNVDPSAQVDLSRTGPGSTQLHVTARLRSTGQVVATADIPVTVG